MFIAGSPVGEPHDQRDMNNFFGWGMVLRVTDPEGVQLAAK